MKSEVVHRPEFGNHVFQFELSEIRDVRHGIPIHVSCSVCGSHKSDHVPILNSNIDVPVSGIIRQIIHRVGQSCSPQDIEKYQTVWHIMQS